MEYLAVSDYALLRGCSERYVRKMIQQNVLTAEEILGVVGNSGRQYRIPLASIETKYIKKWKRMQAKKNGGQSKTNETEQPIFFMPFAENITAEERDEIALWKNILGEWQKYRDGAKSKKKADAEYLSYLSEKYPGMRFSQRILYRKMEAVKQNGDMALIDRRGKHGNHAKAMAEALSCQLIRNSSRRTSWRGNQYGNNQYRRQNRISGDQRCLRRNRALYIHVW